MPDLSKHDLKVWQEFTSSNAFRNGIDWLKDHHTPEVAKGLADGMIFDSGKVAGFSAALKLLHRIGNPPAQERSADQPGLESPEKPR